jgi:hypothetical protein
MLIWIMETSVYIIGFAAVGLTLLDSLIPVAWLVTLAGHV